MKTGCFIPIKVNSTRVPGKNFSLVGGKALYLWVFEVVKAARDAGAFDFVVVDTNAAQFPSDNSSNLLDDVEALGFIHHPRKPALAEDTVNGNDLMVHWRQVYPDTDRFFQIFVTGLFLQRGTILRAAEALGRGTCDSVLTMVKRQGWFWFGGSPVNYMPGVLPRSQDSQPVMEETTALYGITKASLDKYRCRIGANLVPIFVDDLEATDIDTLSDLSTSRSIVDSGVYADWLAGKSTEVRGKIR